MKLLFFGIIAFSLVLALAIAQPNFVHSINNKAKNPVQVVIPEHARELAPGVFSLGEINYDGKIIEGIAFLHYSNKKANAKPGTVCGNNICEPGENAKKCAEDCGGNTEEPSSTCFAYISNGLKWKDKEPWIVNPTNSEGLSDSFILNNINSQFEEWEVAAGVDIMGDGSLTTTTLVADTSNPDGQNEIYFGSIAEPNVIAVTTVWGIFRGPPSSRKIVEMDQVYNDVDFDWSSNGEAGKMDFENIGQHETGHGLGLGHPKSECTQETMYAFASNGEIIKRDLHDGDIAGIQNLYA